MLLSSESLLQLLQRFIKNAIEIKQIHSLLITNGDLLSIPNPSTFKWTTTILYNTLIRAYLNVHLPHTTLLLFTHMISSNIPPNAHTFPSIAKAAASYTTPSIISKPLYVQALKRGVLADPFVQTSFICLYAETGCVSCARKVFDEMPEPCVVSCNAMLDGFCKNGDMGSAVLFFERMPMRDVYSWTSIVKGYDRNGCYKAAIRFFQQMIMQRCLGDCFAEPNEATFVSVLSSCANSAVGGLLNGKQIHGYIIKNEDQVTAFTGTALITLYGKTGGLEYAMKVFKSMIKTKVCTWNAMIGALASNGKEKQAFEMFDKMNLGGWHPNAITFVVILAACARAKLIDFGFEVFYSMMPRFGILPRMEHYGCMVDLLGRAGFLAEARDFLKRMPFEPDATVLGALLGACKLHGDIELGDEVAKRLLELQPEKCGQYILLSSIYAEAEKWERASDLRNIMVGAGVEKPPAYSVVNAM
ncbi:putative pentatricopeptide repeat-containing protein At1g10330 [Cynara cardunculus var. scolymus]|uniref:putative pentatricopeptide repeat-containing protein At1g10330 n=1 Tax=Cynara cardunculus var. scolymus TaxID=59895 RepID=UPI000D62C7FD|nr:putative pentatricopeptide repeat-containing protein At1g10330 [Cynara cardunculus var. scolymus]